MQPIPYKIIRSNRKSLGLEITPAGDLVIRAPRRMSQTHIDRAIERHRKWIENHRKTALERQKNHPEPSDEQRLAMIERAKELIPRRVAHYSAVMGLAFLQKASPPNPEKPKAHCRSSVPLASIL